MTARCSNCSVTLALVSMLVPKPQFQGSQRKYLPQKSKFHLKKNFLTDLDIKQLNLFVFGSHAWQISSNWSFQRNVGFNLERAQTFEHSFTQSLNNSSIRWSFRSESSKHCLSLMIRAKELTFWENIHPHVSHVICRMSGVTCQASHFFDMVVELVGGGSVINGPYPV